LISTGGFRGGRSWRGFKNEFNSSGEINGRAAVTFKRRGVLGKDNAYDLNFDSIFIGGTQAAALELETAIPRKRIAKLLRR
jgi:hypothetical protein